jgi:hypothetical protein
MFDNGLEKECASAMLMVEKAHTSLPPDLPIPIAQIEHRPEDEEDQEVTMDQEEEDLRQMRLPMMNKNKILILSHSCVPVRDSDHVWTRWSCVMLIMCQLNYYCLRLQRRVLLQVYAS